MERRARVVFAIGRLRKLLRQRFEAHTAALEITVPQYHVLHRLWESDGLLTCALMRDAGSDGGTITGVLERLEAKGWISRARDAEDRRAMRVSLTPAGRALEEPVEAALAATAAEALAGFSESEIEELLTVLERMGGNLGA